MSDKKDIVQEAIHDAIIGMGFYSPQNKLAKACANKLLDANKEYADRLGRLEIYSIILKEKLANYSSTLLILHANAVKHPNVNYDADIKKYEYARDQVKDLAKIIAPDLSITI